MLVLDEVFVSDGGGGGGVEVLLTSGISRRLLVDRRPVLVPVLCVRWFLTVGIP